MNSEFPHSQADSQRFQRELEEITRCSQQIINCVHEGIVVHGLDLRHLVWNPYMERITGIAAAEVVGKHPLEVFPFLHDVGVIAALEKALSGETPEPVAFSYLVSSTGRTGWVSVLNAPLRGAAGDVIGVIGTVRDITESKLIEDTQLFLSQSGWSASGEDFFAALARFLAESLKMDYVCIDLLLGEGHAARTVAIYYDGTYEDSIEYSLEDTPCGSVVGEIVCCFPREVRRLFPGDAVLQEMVAESYVGATLWGSSGQPIGLIAIIGRNPLENPRLAEAILKLVTVRAAGELERREAEDALRKTQASLELRVMERTRELSDSNARLRQEMAERERLEVKLIEARKLESIGQLAGGVAHEVRNPLNAILSITEALFREKEIETNPEFEPYITHIRTQVHRLARLMSELLALGKPIPEASLEPVPLYELCRETLDLWKSSGLAANKRVILQASDDALHSLVLADGMRLQQVLYNLLENAGHHSPAGEKILFQVCSAGACDLSDGMANVRVVDRGEGIAENCLARVFDPFYSDRRGGTGLGLTLVRHFVEGMGGVVTIENNDPPPGCTAEVRIPLAREEGV
jgi:PAS domain S-box-containing protein